MSRPEDRQRSTRGDEQPRSVRDWISWGWHTDRASVAIAREVAISIVIVLLLAGLLFSMSGVWPPLVAVESDSMEPQIMTGDLVFIVEPDRFAADGAIGGTGVVPADRANERGHESFGSAGDVIIFAPNGDGNTTPVIHRAHFWVEEDEDWYDRAHPDLIGNAEDCEELSNCPAPHDGFVTHGDNNQRYDQVQGQSGPVKAEWVIARAHLRVPWVGHARLLVTEIIESLRLSWAVAV